MTVEEVVDVRRVLVKAEMERFLQDKELFSSLKRGKVRLGCPRCRAGAVLNKQESHKSHLVLE